MKNGLVGARRVSIFGRAPLHAAISSAMELKVQTRHMLELVRDQQIEIRPAQPSDAEMVQAYVRAMSARSRTFRFHGRRNELTPAELHATIHPRPPTHLSLLAEAFAGGARQMIAEARLYIAAGDARCELAGSVADGWQRQGVGRWLLGHVAHNALRAGATSLVADVLRENWAVRSFACRAGFRILPLSDDPCLIRIAKPLQPHLVDATNR